MESFHTVTYSMRLFSKENSKLSSSEIRMLKTSQWEIEWKKKTLQFSHAKWLSEVDHLPAKLQYFMQYEPQPNIKQYFGLVFSKLKMRFDCGFMHKYFKT